LLSDPFQDDMSSVENSAQLDREHLDKAGTTAETGSIGKSPVSRRKEASSTLSSVPLDGTVSSMGLPPAPGADTIMRVRFVWICCSHLVDNEVQILTLCAIQEALFVC
jgi:hypothetical protein